MVMHNRNGGSDAPHWWDDLPPRVRDRFTRPIPRADEGEPAPRTDEPARLPSQGQLVGDLSRLAVLFALVALGNILFLLVALSFLHS